MAPKKATTAAAKPAAAPAKTAAAKTPAAASKGGKTAQANQGILKNISHDKIIIIISISLRFLS